MRVRRVGLLTLLCAALVSCSSGAGKATVLPKISASAPVTASPDPVPTAAKAATPEGAAAFARFWYSEITRAWALRDPRIIARLSAPGCTACARYTSSIADVRARNQRVEGVIFKLTLVEAQAISGKNVKVSVIYDSPATHGYDSSGREVHSEPAVKNFQEELALLRSGNSWLVQQDTTV